MTHPFMEAETCYGIQKRLAFLGQVVAELRPRRVLDIGCGTGSQVTLPLALKFPEVTFIGADSDAASMAYAREHNARSNLSFVELDEAEGLGNIDLIIASEVIEHVLDPDAFLYRLRSMLAADGALIVTVPNGFGPFELLSFTQSVLSLTGAENVMRDAKRLLFGRSARSVPEDTLAVSPHVNFFSYRSLMRLLAKGGFGVVTYRGRTFLCGFGIDHLVRHPSLIRWNAEVADSLPPAMVSGWMFLLRRQAPANTHGFHPGWYGKLRRWITEQQLGIKLG